MLPQCARPRTRLRARMMRGRKAVGHKEPRPLPENNREIQAVHLAFINGYRRNRPLRSHKGPRKRPPRPIAGTLPRFCPGFRPGLPWLVPVWG